MTVGGKLFSRVTVNCNHRFPKEAHGSDLAQGFGWWSTVGCEEDL